MYIGCVDAVLYGIMWNGVVDVQVLCQAGNFLIDCLAIQEGLYFVEFMVE